jgi:Tfp pilus assembly protein PilO
LARNKPHQPASSVPVPLRGRLLWTVRSWRRLLGWPGVLGVGVLAIFPAFYFSAIQPAQARLEAAHRSTILLNERIERAATALQGSPRTPAEQLAEFYRAFPAEKSSPQWLDKIAAAAQSRGLSLDHGEYKATRDKSGKLVRYQMLLPLKGDYPQIRQFLAALPAEAPVVALESVQFERQKVSDPVIEARIKLVLYLGIES